MPTATEKERMRLQVEQLTCFIEAAYAGLVRDLKVTWKYDWDDRQRELDSPYSARIKRARRKDYGKHTRIDFDTPTYWGSMSGMLYEQAYHMRERLIDKLDDDKRAKAEAALVNEYGPRHGQRRGAMGE